MALPGKSFSISDYLRGTWKRQLEWRHFGGSFEHLKTSNTVVSIEDYHDDERRPTDRGGGQSSRYMRWSFGKTTGTLKPYYVMKFIPDSQGTFLEWEFGGHRCNGQFQPATSVMMLNFYLKSSSLTYTFRVMDAHTMAICIVEVDGKHTPTIQYGNMCRVDPALYPAGAAGGGAGGGGT